jgi:hypothetical protein
MKSKEEIEQLAFLEYPRLINDPYNPMVDDNADERKIWINAYTQCQEDMADKKYTEEDIREAIDMARQLSHVSCLEDGEHRLKYSNTEDDIINSLNKQD